MKQPKPILITEKLASVHPDELKLTPEQAFQAFGLEFQPEYQNLRLNFDVEESWGGNCYRLELFGARPETKEEKQNREFNETKIAIFRELERQKEETREKQELARLKKKYES